MPTLADSLLQGIVGSEGVGMGVSPSSTLLELAAISPSIASSGTNVPGAAAALKGSVEAGAMLEEIKVEVEGGEKELGVKRDLYCVARGMSAEYEWIDTISVTSNAHLIHSQPTTFTPGHR